MSRRAPHEGSIYQRSDGRWVGALDLGTTKDGRQRRSVYGHTQREVLLKLAELRRKQGLGLRLDLSKQTVEQFLDRWIVYKEHQVRPRTLHTYKCYINLHIVPPLGGAKLQQLRATQVQALLDDLAAKMKPRSVASVRGILRAALNDAVRWGECERNAATHAKPPAQERKPVAALSVAEAKVLLGHMEGHRLGALFRIALSLGMRRSEVCGLTWANVDLKAGHLAIVQGLQRAPGVGLVVEKPKSVTSTRTLPLPAFALATLKAHHLAQLEARILAANFWQDTGYVFTDAWGRPVDPDVVSHEFKAVAIKAGMGTLTFHQLRHAAATLLLAQGTPLKVVQEMLGHSTIGLTANTYTHVVPELQRAAADAMDAALGGAQQTTVAGNLTATMKPRAVRPRPRRSRPPAE